MKKYEFLEHPADIKIRVFGKDLPEVFTNAALGMMEIIYGQEVLSEKPSTTTEIRVKAMDLESLMIDWLSDLLYLSDTNDQAYINYKIKDFKENKIIAEVGTCPAKAVDDIKAVTYNELEIEEKNGKWEATVVFDI